MSNDRVIVDEIRATLNSDPRIHNPAEVAISEKAGTVTLRGTVRSLHQRRTAVEIARSVRHASARSRTTYASTRAITGGTKSCAARRCRL